eukprot:440461_1
MGNHVSQYGWALAKKDKYLNKALKREYEFGVAASQLISVSWILKKIGDILVSGNGREIELMKVKLKNDTNWNDEQIGDFLLSILDWLQVAPRKIDEVRLGLVRMAYVHAYGDVADTSEP